MTSPVPASGPPSASGVRRGGDHFQDLFVWGAALQLLRPNSNYTQIEIEVNGVENLDDVILRSRTGGHIYGQVKWASNASTALTEEYLLHRETRSGLPVGRSILQKLFAGYGKVRDESRPPTLRLITNRSVDVQDALLGHIDGRTQLLVPFASQANPSSPAGKAVDAWADHVSAPRSELLGMLEHLEFHPGRTVPAEREYVQASMLAVGLDDSDAAIRIGLDIAAGWIRDGKRVATTDEVARAIEERGLRRGETSAILSVQAIDFDPHANDATAALNWVDRFNGDRPGVRVQPRDPDDWALMDREIADAAATIERDGWTSVLLRGAMRQATFFRIGTALPAVRQHTLHYMQRGQRWSTNAPKLPIDDPDVKVLPMSQGDDLAVAVGVAMDPTAAVADYLRAAQVPALELMTIQPAGGADDQAVENAGQAVTYAQKVRDLIRQELERHPEAVRIHLFLAAPGGLALLLGHRWNRVRPTIVYEHLGMGRGYAPAFRVDA